jgi:ubiquinone/menaquinone biosynthesis C-methylase UbiE
MIPISFRGPHILAESICGVNAWDHQRMIAFARKLFRFMIIAIKNNPRSERGPHEDAKQVHGVIQGVMMELEKLYDPVAEFYDIEHEGFRPDIPFYLEEAKKAGGPVLELASGTGRVSVELAKAGIETVGLDISKGMLEVARRKTSALDPEVQQRLTWIQGDMRGFELGRKFHMIFIPFNSFQMLETRADQEACLACVSRHLEKGSLFVLAIFAPSYDRLVKRSAFTYLGTHELPDGSTLSRTEFAKYDYVNQMISVEWIYDVVDPAGNLKRTLWKFPVRYLWRFEVELLLEKAGLRIEALYGDYTRREFDHNGSMLFLARKQ